MNKITKIIELLIDWDNEDIDDVGVEIMSLVDTPAIGVSWQAFAKQAFDEADDIEMVDGIIELLNKVEDIENRKKMAQDVLEDFEGDNIDYNKERFLELIGLHQMPNGDLMEGTDHKGQEFSEESIIDIINQDTFGEQFDEDNTVYVDFTQEKFNGVTDFIEGVVGLAITGKRDATEETEIKYRYAGPSSSRPFCAALLRLNKVYTKAELQTMGATIGNGIGDTGQDAISVWHGGPNCRHWFNRVSIVRENGRALVTNLGPDREYGTPMADRRLNGYQNAASKKKAEQWYAIQQSYKGNFSEMQFSADEDQMIITGPAMKAFQMIPRKDDNGNMYHVYFSDETIKKISEKFLKDNAHATDINHSMIATEENTLLESWIVTDPDMDKSKALGFNPSKGDWYVSYKINNQETWDKIKDGELNGYSIAGQFLEKAIL